MIINENETGNIIKACPIFKKNGNHPFSSLSLKWVGDGQPEGFVALDAD